MENTIIENAIYFGKIGADNFLLMLVGVLFFVLYGMKRVEAAYERLHIYLAAGAFFTLYSLLNDMYRVKALRPYLLINYSFQPYRTLILLLTLLPLYITLINSIIRILHARFRKNS